MPYAMTRQGLFLEFWLSAHNKSALAAFLPPAALLELVWLLAGYLEVSRLLAGYLELVWLLAGYLELVWLLAGYLELVWLLMNYSLF
jgi:hypothetical protein